MNKILVLILLIGTISFCFAQISEKAVTLYTNGDYQSALDIFLQFEKTNNPDILYNIGNCYFKLNDIGNAVLYYSRTLKFNPNHLLAKSNLDKALELTIDKVEQENISGTAKFVFKLFYFLPINTIAITILLFFVLIVAIALFTIFSKNLQRAIPTFFIFCLSVMIFLFAALAYFRYNSVKSEENAVLIERQTIAYSGPSEEFVQVFSIHQGHIFKILKHENQWVQIKLKNGLTGWVKQSLIKII